MKTLVNISQRLPVLKKQGVLSGEKKLAGSWERFAPIAVSGRLKMHVKPLRKKKKKSAVRKPHPHPLPEKRKLESSKRVAARPEIEAEMVLHLYSTHTSGSSTCLTDKNQVQKVPAALRDHKQAPASKATASTAKPKGSFNLVFAGSSQNVFCQALEEAVNDCGIIYSETGFTITRLQEPAEFTGGMSEKPDLLFMEERFLLDMNAGALPVEKLSTILLLDSFTGQAPAIKKALANCSMGLTGHIALAGLPGELVKTLVMDYIRNRIRTHER